MPSTVKCSRYVGERFFVEGGLVLDLKRENTGRRVTKEKV